MADARHADDRLPWLESARPAKPKPSPASRRARTPLLLLLGLLLAGTVAVMAFLAGRGSGPFDAEPPGSDATPAAVAPTPAPPAASQQAPAPTPLPTPVPALPAAPPAPAATAPAPAPAAAPVRAVARPATAKRTASARRPVARSHRVTVHRNVRAQAAPPRYQWPAPSAAGPSGRVIQLGAYVSGRQTMASWRRLRRAYPYLATLPRKVTIVSPGPGRPHYYRLRIGAPSAAHARAICNNLHRIGRGCTVV
jgi:hypothetical protein